LTTYYIEAETHPSPFFLFLFLLLPLSSLSRRKAGYEKCAVLLSFPSFLSLLLLSPSALSFGRRVHVENVGMRAVYSLFLFFSLLFGFSTNNKSRRIDVMLFFFLLPLHLEK